MTDEQISAVERLVMIFEAGQAENGIAVERQTAYAKALSALLSASKPAEQFPAQPPAQYQMRVILEDGTPWGDWVNVSPEGARTLREKYYAANYEVRELFDRAASPPAPARSASEEPGETL